VAQAPCIDRVGIVFFSDSLRCEHCRYGGDHCALFQMLNIELAEHFNLDAEIESAARCNAFRDASGEDGTALRKFVAEAKGH